MIQNEQQYGHQRKLFNKRLRTIQSIGNFTEHTPDRSIIERRQHFYNNPFSLQEKGKQTVSLSNITKFSRIQNQVNDITKMKMMYQSRITKDKSVKNPNKSIERGSANKSIQKHILKPSNTPNFNKLQHFRKQNNMDISSVDENKSISQVFKQTNQEINQNESIFLSNSLKNSQITQNVQNKYYEFKYQFENSDNDKNKQSMYQIKLEDQFYKPKTPTKINFSEIKCDSNRQQIKLNQSNFHQNCPCESILRQYIQQTNEKMAQITQRLMFLQRQNQKIKQLESRISQKQQQTCYLKQKINQISHENSQLRQSNVMCQNEKQEIEVILKDILFKREREKLQHQISKENTQRSQKDKSQQITQYSRKSIQPVLVKKSMNSINNNNKSMQYELSQKKQNPIDSKLKVQNLLHKLQIKVQR